MTIFIASSLWLDEKPNHLIFELFKAFISESLSYFDAFSQLNIWYLSLKVCNKKKCTLSPQIELKERKSRRSPTGDGHDKGFIDSTLPKGKRL